VEAILYETVGVLLAGGESSRFGQPKAFAKYKGKSFWEHSYEVLKEETDQQLVISRTDLVDKMKETATCKVIVDDVEVKGKGPLAGIYTAMNHEKAEWYFILSCDVPLITNRLIRSLLDLKKPTFKAVIPKVNEKLHPLIGVYHCSIFSLVEKQLTKREYRLLSLLDKIDVLYVSEKEIGVDKKIFSNINSQEDYKLLLTNDKISESKQIDRDYQ
jgi:molybdopterin-guanine dinucleotide biosynthesis protein A